MEVLSKEEEVIVLLGTMYSLAATLVQYLVGIFHSNREGQRRVKETRSIAHVLALVWRHCTVHRTLNAKPSPGVNQDLILPSMPSLCSSRNCPQTEVRLSPWGSSSRYTRADKPSEQSPKSKSGVCFAPVDNPVSRGYCYKVCG